jgi:hypothetical protein
MPVNDKAFILRKGYVNPAQRQEFTLALWRGSAIIRRTIEASLEIAGPLSSHNSESSKDSIQGEYE